MSAALVAVTEQVPVPLVIVTVVPDIEQAPVAANVIDPVPEPPVEPTVKFARRVAPSSACPSLRAPPGWPAWHLWCW